MTVARMESAGERTGREREGKKKRERERKQGMSRYLQRYAACLQLQIFDWSIRTYSLLLFQ
jgi:hypothetical protein